MQPWDADTENKTGLGCISPMWQGNNVFLLCFFFQSCAPGLFYEFLIFVSHWEILRSCDMPAENMQCSQKGWTVETLFTSAVITSHRSPSVLCLAQTVALSSHTVSINDRYLRDTSILDFRSAVYRLLYLTFPASFLLAIIKTRLLTDFQQDNNHHSVSLSCYRSINSC